MSARSAVKRLTEQVAGLIAEYRRLHAKCIELERVVAGLSANVDNAEGPRGERLFLDGDAAAAGSALDREQVKAKLSEMLAELADID